MVQLSGLLIEKNLNIFGESLVKSYKKLKCENTTKSKNNKSKISVFYLKLIQLSIPKTFGTCLQKAVFVWHGKSF
jgi:hypothetical protein